MVTSIYTLLIDIALVGWMWSGRTKA